MTTKTRPMTPNEKISALYIYLTACGIPCDIVDSYEGSQLRFDWCKGDIACHAGTGNQLETYRFPWDGDDVTRMPLVEAKLRITYYYIETLRRDLREATEFATYLVNKR